MTGPEVAGLYGKPGFVRRDGPAEIWRYDGEDCLLDVFLYRERDIFRVAHYELRGDAPGRRCAAPPTPVAFRGALPR